MEYKFIDLDLTEEERKYIRPLWDSSFFLNGKRIELGGQVKKYLSIGNKLLVLIEDDDLTNRNRNIWCYNDQGEKVWEIMDMYDSEEMTNKDTVKRRVDPYIWFVEEEKFLVNGRKEVMLAGTFGGFYGELDIETGKVSNWKWTR